ncbi:phosphoribosyltransferase [Fodinicurvata sp. EGI_FJ10296]|uniref:phosphoribosyltransferase n=1 Tax=Fodinicurvata sp. EGI_FJ10296 TaxID=3231908 RepID=UPI003453A9BD
MTVRISEASFAPHDYWQTLYPPGSIVPDANGCYGRMFPGSLPDGRQIALPIRPLPRSEHDEGPAQAVASLILTQAGFLVEESLVSAAADLVRRYEPDIVVAVPTLGLIAGRGVARALGHGRYVALGTSRKFWYREELSVPMSSITSPGPGKTLWLDPRMVPLLEGARVALVDDAVSTGRSLTAAMSVLRLAGIEPVCAAVAMLQTDRWRAAVENAAPGFSRHVHGVFQTPILVQSAYDPPRWRPA